MENDERFAGIATDPRFRTMPSQFKKTKIDDRFKGMFKEKQFNLSSKIDKRGKPIRHNATDHLKKYYDLSSDEGSSGSNEAESDEEESEEIIPTQKKEKEVPKTKKQLKRERKLKKESQQTSESEEEQITAERDYARGEAVMSSSDDEDSSDEEAVPLDQEAHDDHYWGENDADAEMTEDATPRLAIVNMDWDKIRAVDLLALLNSFKPSTGTILSVKIYPSEYGKEKMAEDNLKGPKELTNVTLDDEGKATKKKLKKLSEKEQELVLRENLRQYQLNRLRYYYAVAECDTVNTADHIYTQCDGQEYLASCTQIDLRFIPDGMEFDESEVKDTANYVPDNYAPKFFANSALGQSLVRCTWDETNEDRTQALNRKYKPTELESLDVQCYLASESEDETPVLSKKGKRKEKKEAEAPVEKEEEEEEGSNDDSDDGVAINRYKALLLGGPVEEKEAEKEDVDMEITWDTGLKETAKSLLKSKEEEKLGVFDRKMEKKRREKREKKKKNKKNANKEEGGATQTFSDDEVDVPEEMLAMLSEGEREAEGDKDPEDGKPKKQHRKKAKKDKPQSKEEDTELALMAMDSDDDKQHFNIKEIAEYENMSKSKRKRKLKTNKLKDIQDDFKIDVADDRFNALYTSHLYNIDPASQEFRKTKSMTTIIEEKQRRIREPPRAKKPRSDSANGKTGGEGDAASSKADISKLVKSVKAKSKAHALKATTVTKHKRS